jgi:hypothetical protein
LHYVGRVTAVLQTVKNSSSFHALLLLSIAEIVTARLLFLDLNVFLG